MLGEEVVHKHLSVEGEGAVHLAAIEVGGEEAKEWEEARLRNSMQG